MAKQHKRATEVTVVPTEEKSGLQEFVDRWWKPSAVIAVLVAAGILISQARRESAQDSRGADWDALAGEMQLGGLFGGTLSAESGRKLTDLAGILEDSPAGPAVSVLEVTRYLEEGEVDGARAALDRLAERYPDHPLVTEEHAFEPGSPALTAVAFLSEKITAEGNWRAAHPSLFANPPLPADAPRVRITTGLGDLVVGLYSDRAPAHVENFLKHCREGSYVGTRFHRVVPGFMVQGGDPNSVDGDPSTWGQGGPGYKLDPELDDELHHFEAVLAAAKTQFDTQSSGSQFYVTVGPAHHLDGQHTIFGALLEGPDVAATISDLPRVEGTERPEESVEILAVEILE